MKFRVGSRPVLLSLAALSMLTTVACGGAAGSSIVGSLFAGAYSFAYVRGSGTGTAVITSDGSVYVQVDDSGTVYNGSGSVGTDGSFSVNATNGATPAQVITVAGTPSAPTSDHYTYDISIVSVSGGFSLGSQNAAYAASNSGSLLAGSYAGTFTGTKTGPLNITVDADNNVTINPAIDAVGYTGTGKLIGFDSTIGVTVPSANAVFIAHFAMTNALSRTVTGTWSQGSDSGTFSATLALPGKHA